jgi:hypothetical protein
MIVAESLFARSLVGGDVTGGGTIGRAVGGGRFVVALAGGEVGTFGGGVGTFGGGVGTFGGGVGAATALSFLLDLRGGRERAFGGGGKVASYAARRAWSVSTSWASVNR